MNMEFEPIEFDRQQAYLQQLSQCDQVASDYSFVNLWGWRDAHGLRWAWHDDLVWILQTVPRKVLWAPVGNWKSADWEALWPILNAHGNQMIRIPEALLNIWRSTLASMPQPVESREHWDYLYDRRDLVDLKGNKFHKKKNLVNQFKKKYASSFLPFGSEMVEQAKGMQEDWCTWRDCESHETLAAENTVITKVLDHWEQLDGVTGGALKVEDRLAAYTIAEDLPDGTLVIHFEKGDPEYKGSYQAINQMFLEQDPSPSTLVNREQDLGSEGLRKAKLSYHPVDFVRKYQIRL
jgi:hypothetical protein